MVRFLSVLYKLTPCILSRMLYNYNRNQEKKRQGLSSMSFPMSVWGLYSVLLLLLYKCTNKRVIYLQFSLSSCYNYLFIGIQSTRENTLNKYLLHALLQQVCAWCIIIMRWIFMGILLCWNVYYRDKIDIFGNCSVWYKPTSFIEKGIIPYTRI